MALYDNKGKYIGKSKGSFLDKTVDVVKDIGLGAAKGLGSTAGGFAKLLTSPTGAASLSAISPALGAYSMLAPNSTKKKVSSAIGETTKKLTTPSNTPQKIGFAAEQTAEMFIPLGIEDDLAKSLSKIPELAKNAPLLSRIVSETSKTLAKPIASGAEYGAKALIQTGGDMKETAKTAGIAAAVPFVSGVVKGLSKGIAKSVIPLSAKEAKMVQAYKADVPFWQRFMAAISDRSSGPVTAGETAFSKGIAGTESMIGTQAKKAQKNIWSRVVGPSLSSSKEEQSMTQLWDDIEKEIIENNPELSRQKSLLKALTSLKNDYKGVKNVDMTRLQQIKEGWSKFVPEKFYKGENIAGSFNEVKGIASSVVRDILYNKMGPELKRAYIDYGNFKNLAGLGQKAMTGGKLKGGFGSFWNAVKDLAIVPVGTLGGQGVYKLAGLFEFIGKPGARTLQEIFTDSISSQQ